MPNFQNLRTVKQIAAESRGTFSEASLRWMVFKAASNGLEPALIRVGRRVLIDSEGFNDWLEQHRNLAAPLKR